MEVYADKAWVIASTSLDRVFSSWSEGGEWTLSTAVMAACYTLTMAGLRIDLITATLLDHDGTEALSVLIQMNHILK